MANTKTISVILAVDLEMLAMETAKAENRSRNFILNRWIRNGMALEGGGKFRVVGDTGIEAQDKKNRDGVGYVVGAQSLVDRVGAMVPDPVFGAEGEIQLDPPKGWFDPRLASAPVPLDAGTDFQPDPVISQNEKQTQKGKLTVEYKKGVPVSKKIARVAAPGAGPGFPKEPLTPVDPHRHDPKTCAVYGCLMCKAAKESA